MADKFDFREVVAPIKAVLFHFFAPINADQLNEVFVLPTTPDEFLVVLVSQSPPFLWVVQD